MSEYKSGLPNEKKIKNNWRQVREVRKLEETQGPQLEKQRKKGWKNTIVICLAALFVLTGGFVLLQLQKPYAITVNDKQVMIVQNKDTAADVIETVMKDYKPENSKVISVSLDKEIDSKRMMLWEDWKLTDIVSEKKAVSKIEEKNGSDKPMFTATIVGKTRTEEDYTPEPEYKKDDDMYAGEAVIEKEGTDGKKLVTRKITTVNGQVTDTKVTKEKITEEGKAAVIIKGTMGLPDGEDWKTYEGDPVFKGADDLVKISMKYRGVPYKYGGSSLVTGVDCVQFVRQIYKKYGINLPNHHSGLRSSGVAVSYSNMQKGDIICYSKHVAIYIGDGKIIHSTHGAGVHVSNVYKGQKIVTIRRIVE